MAPTRPRHLPLRRTHRVRHIVALTLTGVLAFAGAAAAAMYVELQSKIDTSDVDALLGQVTDRPTLAPADPDDPYAGQALNVLVMGTDFRGEGNDALAGDGDEFHSDSTLVVHVSGDRSWVEVVSIPRDSLVDIPACPLPGGGTSKPRRGAMFNEAFTIGGGATQDVTGAAACTILTVEKLTGVAITDHVVVKMNGVIGVVDAIGGVRMCFPEPVKGSMVDLDLPAGQHTLTGYEAINFLRARKGQGMGLELGSDLERIKRQQAFFDAMMREVLAQNVVTDSPRLYQMVAAVLGSISTNPEIGSPAALAGLAWSLRDIDTTNIVFTPLAVATAPTNKDRVVWVISETKPLWARIAAGDPPPSVAASRSGASDDGSGDSGAGGGGGGGEQPQGGASTDTGAPVGGGAGSPTAEPPAGSPTDGSPTAGQDEATPTPTPSLLPGVCP
ncbi:LCP family protein [Xylanimonas protaetiae]|uniref:LytR family transcriptional regulator n=1 Tax=Xylanimonas protaetiae TaxID=2509457 RepID=A0A4P6FII9_9MICO|nr:LCP family protein [Xylanimonas protaetiae]QAY70378.1 LytR family transcriptional regulator [Xylanimonas protaetiae]